MVNRKCKLPKSTNFGRAVFTTCFEQRRIFSLLNPTTQQSTPRTHPSMDSSVYVERYRRLVQAVKACNVNDSSPLCPHICRPSGESNDPAKIQWRARDVPESDTPMCVSGLAQYLGLPGGTGKLQRRALSGLFHRLREARLLAWSSPKRYVDRAWTLFLVDGNLYLCSHSFSFVIILTETFF